MWEATFSRTNPGYDPGCFGNYIIIIKISRIICKNIYSIDLKLKKERVAQKRLNRATLCHDQREVSHDEKIISYIANRYNLYKTLLIITYLNHL